MSQNKAMNRWSKILAFGLLIGRLTSCHSVQEKGTFDYPKIESTPKSMTHFNVEIVDHYSTLSNVKDISVLNWLGFQDSLSKKYFSENRIFQEYKQRFEDLGNNQTARIHHLQVSENGRYFYLRYNDSTHSDAVYYRNSSSGKEIFLYDPSGCKNKSVEINYLSPSFDGSKIAIGFNPKESFTSEVIFLDVEQKTILPDTLKNINPEYGGVQWLPTSIGFTYLYFPTSDKSSTSFKRNSFTVLHLLGQDVGNPKPVFKNPLKTDTAENVYPKVSMNPSIAEYAIGYMMRPNLQQHN